MPEFAQQVHAADPTVPSGLTVAASVAPREGGGNTIVVNAGGAGVWLQGSMDLLRLPRIVKPRLRAALDRLTVERVES